MARLNIKSTKAAFLKMLQKAEAGKAKAIKEQMDLSVSVRQGQIIVLLDLAKELEIAIKPEDYKQA